MIEVGETFSSQIFKLTDSSGAPGAATVTCSVVLPDQTVASPTVTTPTLGDYVFDYLTTQAGRHPYTVTATGGVLGTLVRKFSDVFIVGAAQAPGIVSLAEVKDHLNIPQTTTRSDAELELMIAAATDKIEQRCGPVTVRTIANERHDGGRRAIWLNEAPGPGGNPTITVTSLVSVSTSVAATVSDLDVDPIGRVAYKDMSMFPRGAHYVTYTAGRALIPAALRQAALNYVKGSWETQRGASGLPWSGAQDQPIEVPGMGLVLWRLEQDLRPFALAPAVT